MTSERTIEMILEELRQGLPDPFELRSNSEAFFRLPAAQELLTNGEKTARAIIEFLRKDPNPALVRPAMLLLSRFAPALFYEDLLRIIEKSAKRQIEALESGLWNAGVPEEQIAQDLVNIVFSSGNPYPLLLLQRPAATAVRSSLAQLIQQRQWPASLYGLYSYGYAVKPEDIPLLKQVSRWTDAPEMAALAGLYLLRLGSKEGLEGIRAGLVAPNQELRNQIYREVAGYLSKAAVAQAEYDPLGHGQALEVAARRLVSGFGF